MTNALSTLTTDPGFPAIRGGIPSASTRTASVLGYLYNNLEPIWGDFRRYALSAVAAPTDEQRALLLARRDVLDAGLAGADETTIREQVGILRSGMATAPMSEAAMHLAKRGFLLVLSQYPAWAVVEAAMRFLDGRAGSGTFAPQAAEMANVCRDLVSSALAERARINAVLDAEVYHVASAAERAEIQAMHATFVAETAERARTSASKPAPEPCVPRRDRGLAADLAARQARRETRGEGAQTDPHPANASLSA